MEALVPLTNRNKNKMKSNREKNQTHEAKTARVVSRPKQPVYDFTGIDAVVRQWVKAYE